MNSWEFDSQQYQVAHAAAASAAASADSAAKAASAASAASSAANTAASAAHAAAYAAAEAHIAAVRASASVCKRDRDAALKARQKARTWTDEEDNHILASVNANGTKGWATVGKPIRRTAAQCAQRWHKVLNPSIKKFVKWTSLEDARLVAIHQAHPEWSNKEIAEYMPGRTSTQCDNRWRDKANPALRWGEWSYVEDQSMLEGRAAGLSWTNIVKTYPCLVNRAAVAVKNRWHSLQRPKANREMVASREQPG